MPSFTCHRSKCLLCIGSAQRTHASWTSLTDRPRLSAGKPRVCGWGSPHDHPEEAEGPFDQETIRLNGECNRHSKQDSNYKVEGTRSPRSPFTQLQFKLFFSKCDHDSSLIGCHATLNNFIIYKSEIIPYNIKTGLYNVGKENNKFFIL